MQKANHQFRFFIKGVVLKESSLTCHIYRLIAKYEPAAIIIPPALWFNLLCARGVLSKLAILPAPNAMIIKPDIKATAAKTETSIISCDCKTVRSMNVGKNEI